MFLENEFKWYNDGYYHRMDYRKFCFFVFESTVAKEVRACFSDADSFNINKPKYHYLNNDVQSIHVGDNYCGQKEYVHVSLESAKLICETFCGKNDVP